MWIECTFINIFQIVTWNLKFWFKAITVYVFVFLFKFLTRFHNTADSVWIIAESKSFANLSVVFVSTLFQRIDYRTNKIHDGFSEFRRLSPSAAVAAWGKCSEYGNIA